MAPGSQPRAVRGRPREKGPAAAVGLQEPVGMRGRVSQIFNYPFTYNVHRVRRELKSKMVRPAKQSATAS